MELTINGKKAIDVFEGDLQFFCEILDESGYSVKHDDKNEVITGFDHRLAEQTVELRAAPRPVELSEPAALQPDA